MKKAIHLAALLLCIFFLLGPTVFGIILYSSPGRITTRPDDANGGPGWDLQGAWGSYLGTPVASQYFITANHVGGDSTMKFRINNTDYSIDSTFNGVGYVALNDLRIWKITGSFSNWAYLYNGYDEINKAVTIIGRGTQRGSEIIVDSVLKGWMWGTGDRVQSWGRNIITDTPLDGTYGPLLAFNFDAPGSLGISNEGQVSNGDSGGADFIQVGDNWALAGLNLAVSGPYNTLPTGSGFNAAIFDGSGLYEYDGSIWVPSSGPGTGYSTRISSHIDWLKSWIPLSELRLIPESGTCILMGTVTCDPNGAEGYPLDSVTVELHQGGTVETHETPLTGSGSSKTYSFSTGLSGACDVVILQNNQAGWFGDDSHTNVTLSSVTMVNFSLTHAIPGDADMDGMVYDSDIDILNGCYGIVDGSAVWCIGDFDGDGNVYDSDVDILNGCYGLGVE